MTPITRRYREAKKSTGNALLLLRTGDFIELLYDDAEIAAKALGLTLTTRTTAGDTPMVMAGFTHHHLDAYVAKLTAAGHRVAVVEQY